MPPCRNSPRDGRAQSASNHPPKKRKPRVQSIPPVVKADSLDILDAINKKAKTPITVESDCVTQALKNSEWLVKSEEVLYSEPPDRYGRYDDFSESCVRHGKELCAPHEEDLVRLEKIIEPVIMETAWNGDVEKKKTRAVKVDEALSEYRQLVMNIIIQNASQTSPEQGRSPSSFTIKDSPVSRVNSRLWIAPWSSSAVSKTIVSGQNTPALLWLQNGTPLSDSFRPTTRPKKLVDSLAFEVASQMPQRFAQGAKSHQGIAFDGLMATLLVLRCDKPGDIFKEHKTAFARSSYAVPLCRPAFVSKMTQLLRSHLDYRDAYGYYEDFRAYNVGLCRFDKVKAPVMLM